MAGLVNELKRIAKDLLFLPGILKETRRLARAPVSLDALLDRCTRFVLACRLSDSPGFGFTPAHRSADLYSTAYAVSYLGLTGRLNELSAAQRSAIGDYLRAHQSEDGLFRDPGLISSRTETGQGWGWMHLLPHIIIALDYLDQVPDRPFRFATDFVRGRDVADWYLGLSGLDPLSASNHFMNLVVALQYARDMMAAPEGAEAVEALLDLAQNRLIPEYLCAGAQGGVLNRSKMVKTIYHLLPSLVYQRTVTRELEQKVLRLTLATQRWHGGFGASILCDACEDIDSIYHLSVLPSAELSGRVEQSLSRALAYLPMNSVKDGGMVFRRFKPFCYGECLQLASAADCGNLFATWFRVLSYAFADTALHGDRNVWSFSRVPGYQYLPPR